MVSVLSVYYHRCQTPTKSYTHSTAEPHPIVVAASEDMDTRGRHRKGIQGVEPRRLFLRRELPYPIWPYARSPLPHQIRNVREKTRTSSLLGVNEAICQLIYAHRPTWRRPDSNRRIHRYEQCVLSTELRLHAGNRCRRIRTADRSDISRELYQAKPCTCQTAMRARRLELPASVMSTR